MEKVVSKAQPNQNSKKVTLTGPVAEAAEAAAKAKAEAETKAAEAKKLADAQKAEADKKKAEEKAAADKAKAEAQAAKDKERAEKRAEILKNDLMEQERKLIRQQKRIELIKSGMTFAEVKQQEREAKTTELKAKIA